MQVFARLADRADRDPDPSGMSEAARDRGYRDGVKDSAAIVLELLK